MKKVWLFSVCCVMNLLVGCSFYHPSPFIVEWRALPEARVLSFDDAWQIVVAKISENFDLEAVDSKVGYLRTTHKQLRNENISVKITVKTDSKDPVRMKIKVEKFKFNRKTGMWVLFARDIDLEREILEELTGRIR